MQNYPSPSSANYPQYPSDLILKHVTLVHRHGARSPVFSNAEFPKFASWNHCNLIPSFFSAFHTVHKDHHELDITFEGKGAEQITQQMQKLNANEWLV